MKDNLKNDVTKDDFMDKDIVHDVEENYPKVKKLKVDPVIAKKKLRDKLVTFADKEFGKGNIVSISEDDEGDDGYYVSLMVDTDDGLQNFTSVHYIDIYGLKLNNHIDGVYENDIKLVEFLFDYLDDSFRFNYNELKDKYIADINRLSIESYLVDETPDVTDDKLTIKTIAAIEKILIPKIYGTYYAAITLVVSDDGVLTLCIGDPSMRTKITNGYKIIDGSVVCVEENGTQTGYFNNFDATFAGFLAGFCS